MEGLRTTGKPKWLRPHRKVKLPKAWVLPYSGGWKQGTEHTTCAVSWTLGACRAVREENEAAKVTERRAA